MNKPIVIKDFQYGIAPSPHVGFGDMRNLDVTSIPGIARIKNIPEKTSSTTVVTRPLWVTAQTDVATLWVLDSGQKVYKSTDAGGSWALVTGNGSGNGGGAIVWNNYLFVARAAKLDVYGPLSGSPSWTTDWQTIDTASGYHPMFISKNDGKLYIGAANYIASIEQLSTFDPATGGTFTYTQQALDLPPRYTITCLEELGNNLMIGTSSTLNGGKTADIFPWDRSSPSFGQPVSLNEFGVGAMVNINNSLFIGAGTDGKIFESNGYQAVQIAQIPLSVVNTDGGKLIAFYPGSFINHFGRLVFGVSSSSVGGQGGLGVWSLTKTSKGYALTIENTISTGNSGATNFLAVSALYSVARDTLVIGWQDHLTYGIDKINNLARYTSYAAYLESPLYVVGSNLAKRHFTQVEFQLARPLATDQGIRLGYRNDTTSAYTTIGTYTYATLGAVTSHNISSPGIAECDMVQIKAELTTATGNGNTTPQLKSITLI